MVQPTIDITGIGYVEINTTLPEVTLVGAITAKGHPVNCKTKIVRRNKRAAQAAKKVYGVGLKEIKPGFFILEYAPINGVG